MNDTGSSAETRTRKWVRPKLNHVGTLRDVGSIVKRPGFDTRNNHGS
ncbi:hypothetical protein [Croceicoccus pelagius]|nr:hypothetical protein [Croceicoccus pelagius]